MTAPAPTGASGFASATARDLLQQWLNAAPMPNDSSAAMYELMEATASYLSRTPAADEDMRERCARICEERVKWFSGLSRSGSAYEDGRRHEAATIRDRIRALPAHGTDAVTVPREPTEKMLQEACKIIPGALNHRAVWFIWEAMLAAARKD